MEEEGIGKVLVKATELRYKIINCIETTTTIENKNNEQGNDEENELAAETLVNIRDALQTLETQLSSLQALQQQQIYEKETSLTEIDSSRKMLLAKLNDYKAVRDLEVINEAIAFASESVKRNDDDGYDEYDDLLLPPYPIRPPRSLFAGNGFPSHDSNGVLVNNKSRRIVMQESRGRSSWKGWRPFLSVTTKMVVTLVGVISVLTLAGFEPNKKIITPKKLLGLFVHRGKNVGGSSETMCPPGKVMVVENGETRCLVKERVVIPFKSVVSTPDLDVWLGIGCFDELSLE